MAITNSESEQAKLIDESKSLVSDICKDHVAAAQASVQDPALCEVLVKSIESECQELCDYVMATKRFNLEVNARSKDRVISFGEKLSCLFMTTLLQDSVCVLQIHTLKATVCRDNIANNLTSIGCFCRICRLMRRDSRRRPRVAWPRVLQHGHRDIHQEAQRMRRPCSCRYGLLWQCAW